MKARLKRPAVEVVIDTLGWEHRARYRGMETITTQESRRPGESVLVPLPPGAALLVEVERVAERREWVVGGQMVSAEPLDWVVTGEHSPPLPCPAARFAELFEIVAE